MDINLPGASGVEATRRASQIAPGTAVLVVTTVDDDDTVFAALAAGARGYVLKGASADQITAALRTVAAGGATFGAGVATRLLARTPGRLPGPASPSRPDDLTMREREVLDLLAEGASNQQIARSLGDLPEDRAEPRLPHPGQAPGRRPDPGRPPPPGAFPRNHGTKHTAHAPPPAPGGASPMTAARVAGRTQPPCPKKANGRCGRRPHRDQDAPNRAIWLLPTPRTLRACLSEYGVICAVRARARRLPRALADRRAGAGMVCRGEPPVYGGRGQAVMSRCRSSAAPASRTAAV